MKYAIRFLMPLLCFAFISESFGQGNEFLKSSYFQSINASGTQAKRYSIAKIGYNSHHWQYGGKVTVELFQKYFGTGYEKYSVEIGSGQGTGASLPEVKHLESGGLYHYAVVSLGPPQDINTSYGGYPNKSIEIQVDVRYYAQYDVKITYRQDEVTALADRNQILLYSSPVGTDIADFTVPIAPFNIKSNGNVGIGTNTPITKLHVKDNSGSHSYLSIERPSNTTQAGIQYRTNGSVNWYNFLQIGGNKLQWYNSSAGDIVTMTESGNVGIGNTNPASKLHVGGTSKSANADASADLFSSGGAIIAGGKFLSFDHGYKTHANLSYSTAINPELRFIHQGYYGHVFTTRNDIPRLAIVGSTGNVGIGTTAPNEPLEIGTNNGRAFFGNGGGSNRKGLLIQGIDTGLGYSRLESFSYGDNVGLPLVINDYGGGAVAIGTNVVPEGYKLAVDGKAILEKVVVRKNENWPDYVFSNKYILPNLSELEFYINENEHLPEIPSAEEIESNGQDLGEMNKLLLKKVEELTLYLLAEHKENENQRLELKSLKAEMLLFKKK